MSPQVGGSRECGTQGLRRECGVAPISRVGDPGPAHSAPRESADKVVLHTGKYEELIVCSHEIAASTAQLVAASKVRLRAWPGLCSGSPSPGCNGCTTCGRETSGWGGFMGATCILTHPHTLPGEGQQGQSPPEPPAGVLPHCQRDGRQRGGLHQVGPRADRRER